MRVTHELTVAARCPVDGLPDRYAMIVRATSVVPVEAILAAARAAADMKLYQEELCQRLHREINAEVTLVGYHSGVKTTVTCGGAA